MRVRETHVKSRLESLKEVGVPLLRGKLPKEGFVVKSWLWNCMEQDYTLENPDASGSLFFEKYADADEYFAQAGFSEMKVELIQYKYGLGHTVKSRIILPEARH